MLCLRFNTITEQACNPADVAAVVQGAWNAQATGDTRRRSMYTPFHTWNVTDQVFGYSRLFVGVCDQLFQRGLCIVCSVHVTER